MSLFPTIQNAVLNAIEKPHFSAALPPLSDYTWINILQHSKECRDENERLEFLGDALMYATIGRELYKQIPNGTPHLYTELRAALHSNATFSRLAEKLDIFAVNRNVLKALTARSFGEGTAPSKSRPEVKATADLFETVIGAYYLERGFEALCAWVADLYGSLISAGKKAYDNFKKRDRAEQPIQVAKKQFKKSRVAQTAMKPWVTKSRAAICSPLRLRCAKLPARHTAIQTSHRVVRPRRETSPCLAFASLNGIPGSVKGKGRPIVIDLTLLDDDSPEDDTILVNTATVSKNPRQQRPTSSSSTPPHPLADDDDASDSEEEKELESMLLSNEFSDMGLASGLEYPQNLRLLAIGRPHSSREGRSRQVS